MKWIDFNDPMHVQPGDKLAGHSPWKLTAVTFFDPRFGNSKEIIELIEFLNAFSGNHIDILISGCTELPPPGSVKSSLIEIKLGNKTRYYSPETLQKDVALLETETSWRFSMEIDVILFNQRNWWNEARSGIERDYKDSIVVNLYRMYKDGKISSYAAFFREMIYFAKDYVGDRPSWNFSDSILWKELKKSLFESFKTYLGFRDFQIRVEDYAVKNITK